MIPLSDLAAITVDVDSSACYRGIHGLDGGGDDPDPIFTVGVPRLAAWLAERGVHGTFFVVARDLQRNDARECIAALSEAGHEVACHSYAHDYGLSQRPPAVIDADLNRARNIIAEVTGALPEGFRAPGYNLSEALCDSIERTGFAYDSSLLPVPAYFAARASIIALYKRLGRPTQSLVGDVREFAATRRPFRPSRTARFRAPRGDETARAYVELPMSAVPKLRLPWIGTTLTALPKRVGTMLTTAVLTEVAPAILELHAIDACDASDGFSAALAAAQRDLRVPVAQKAARLGAVFDALARRRHVEPLNQIARRVV